MYPERQIKASPDNVASNVRNAWTFNNVGTSYYDRKIALSELCLPLHAYKVIYKEPLSGSASEQIYN
jgi:hypothetical protein